MSRGTHERQHNVFGRSMIMAALSLTLLLMGAPVFGAIVTFENSLIPVLTVEVSRQDRAVIGEEFTIVYLIKNISDKPAYEIGFAFNVMEAVDDFPFTITAPEPIYMLEAGASAVMSVKFKVDGTARERIYRINNIVTCRDAILQNPISYSAICDVPISFSVVKPNLVVTELSVLEDEPDPRDGFTIRLGLKNTSLMYDLRNVLAQLDGGEAFEIMEITNKKEITRMQPLMTHYLEYRLRAREGRKTNTIGLTTSFSYADGSVQGERETLYLPIKEEDEEKNEGIPRVIIKRYSLSKDQVLAGDRIDLTVEIENTNTRPVKNVLINFGVESIGSDASATSSTVFAPVGSSNTFHVEEIKGKSTITNTITFAVDSGAVARTYIVPVTINYEDEKGEYANLSTRDNVNIPVTQQAKLSVSSMTFPSFGFVGTPTPVMAEFVNSGKVDLADFSVRLEGSFEFMDATMYMAKLSMGVTTSYTGMLIPLEAGESEGRLVVSYLDNNNQAVEEEYPFSVSVSAMDEGGMYPGYPGGDWNGDMFQDSSQSPDDGPWYIRILKEYWIYGSLALVIIIQFAYMIRIKKKAKEAFFDE